MEESPANLRSRELGHALRQAMVTREISGLRMSRLLGWSQPKVSRLLNGRRGTQATDVAAFLAHCLVLGEERDRLIAIAGELDKEDWLQQFGSRLPEQVHTYVDHEVRASTIYDFQALVLPGLLQTEDYARAVIERGANIPADEIEERVDARLARHRIFSAPNRPRFFYYLDEFVLWRPVGNKAIMSEQLHHLLRLSVREGISIRVVPRSAGAHGALAGAFSLLSSEEYLPVVYLEGETSGTFLEKRETITAYRTVLNNLAELALDEGKSRDLIGSVAVDLYASQEDRHAVSQEQSQPGRDRMR